jgi:outer membrane protein assembly factor BamB
MKSTQTRVGLSFVVLLMLAVMGVAAEESWLQLKSDSRHSGNVPDRSVTVPLGLVAAVPLTDAVFTAPVVSDGHVYVVDGAGVAFGIDAATLQVLWKRPTRGGGANCNNVSSPAIAGGFLHLGTMAGSYYVLDAACGRVVREIACGEPIFASPAVDDGRVYFATLGSQVHALEPNGTVCWKWDYVKEVLAFAGDRWSGEEWVRHKQGRVTPAENFICARDLAMYDRRLVFTAGSTIVCLQDAGDKPELVAVFPGSLNTVGLSIGEGGKAYREWHRNDNAGGVQMVQVGQRKIEELGTLPGTRSDTAHTALGFSSVSLRGEEVFRTQTQTGFGLCRHAAGQQEPQVLCPAPAIAPPVILKEAAVYGDLKGSLHVVPLAGGKPWTWRTPFGKAISAPVAVADGRIYFGCEDGYLYVLGPEGKAPLPSEDLGLWKVRSRLTSALADARYDRFTSFGDWANNNASDHAVKPPFKVKWMRRYEGTTKHFSTCGGGRLYTHTAEGQVFAVEQETGRQLWRVFFPGVHISYTSPLYFQERLLVPQAGLEHSRLRCLDAATGKLLWEAPFSGSPNWTRQQPPVVLRNLAFYAFSTGQFGGEKSPRWLFSADGFRGYHPGCKPLVRAYDLETGKTVWERDFSKYGWGGDEAGLCLMDSTLYYSCFFGSAPEKGNVGVTAALDPASGRILWTTTEYAVTGHITISGKDGRLYLGGFNPQKGSRDRLVVCLNAKDGALLWKSDVIGGLGTTGTVTVGSRWLAVHCQNARSYLLDKGNGKILGKIGDPSYGCARFTLAEPYFLGPNLDVIDASDPHHPRLISSGPRTDPRECVGAFISNGRLFYTAYGGGIQLSQLYGAEAGQTRSFQKP